MDLRLLRSLIRCTDTREIRDLSCASLLVQSLRVTLLGLFNGDIYEDFNERNALFTSCLTR
jgi:hypothetical protein